MRVIAQDMRACQSRGADTLQSMTYSTFVATRLRTGVALAVLLAGAAPRALAQALPVSTPPPAAAQPSSAVSLKVTGTERMAAPAPVLSSAAPTPTSSSGSENLFVYAQLSYTGTAELHFYADDIGLRDAGGVMQSPQPCDLSSKLSSKILISPPTRPAIASTCLRYTMSTNDASNLALEYDHTEQAAQNAPGTPYHTSVAVFNPSTSTPRRVYATATQPAFKAYVLDEALVGGYIALNVDHLYVGGVDAAVPTSVGAYIKRQAEKLATDQTAFLAIASGSDLKVKMEQANVSRVLAAIEKDLLAAPALRTNAQWARWHTTFTADNDYLASLYDSWPATVASP